MIAEDVNQEHRAQSGPDGEPRRKPRGFATMERKLVSELAKCGGKAGE